MKALGVYQFQQKKFKLLGFKDKWRDSFGDVEDVFSMIVYGSSGNGKTELCMQLAHYLTQWGSVAWISYEQGHGLDLLMAIDRNDPESMKGKLTIIDPIANRKDGMSYYQELDRYIGKRNSPKFIFIDSVDYCNFTWEEVKALKEKYNRRKCLIWISHANGSKPKSSVGEKIEYDASIKVFVKKFIAYIKSRYGGMEDFIIYEEKAKQLNPIYFKAKERS